MADAVVYLDEALEALTLEGWSIADDGAEVAIDRLQLTLADDLERIDKALGCPAFRPMAERIKQAVIAVCAARLVLKGEARNG